MIDDCCLSGLRVLMFVWQKNVPLALGLILAQVRGFNFKAT